MTALKNRILKLELTAPQPDDGPDVIQLVGSAWNGEPEIVVDFLIKDKKTGKYHHASEFKKADTAD